MLILINVYVNKAFMKMDRVHVKNVTILAHNVSYNIIIVCNAHQTELILQYVVVLINMMNLSKFIFFLMIIIIVLSQFVLTNVYNAN